MSNLNRTGNRQPLATKNIIAKNIFFGEKSMVKIEYPTDTRSQSNLLAFILIILTLSKSPMLLSYERRLQSFGKSDDEDAAVCWAQNGFHREPSGVAVCCHCGLQANQLKAENPDELHASKQPDCTFHRTLRFLSGAASVTDSGNAALAARLERKIFKLLEMINSQLTGFIQSFGFSRDEVALGLITYIFSQANGSFEIRPGELIQILHSVPSQVVSFLREVLPEDGALTLLIQSEFRADVASESTTVTTRVEGMTASAIQQINNMQYASRLSPSYDGGATITQHNLTSTEPQLKDDDSPQCLICRRRPRDQVLLPCTHLKFCRECASGLTQCRVCGSEILSQLHVFIV